MGTIVKTLPLLALLSACVGDKSQDSGPSGSDSGDSPEDSVGDSGPSPDDDADGDGFTYWDADCDDTDPNAHPGAAEAAGDGVDSDCDGLDGSAENLREQATVVLTSEEGHPNLGLEVATPGDVSGDGVDDLLIVRNVLGEVGSAEEFNSEVYLLIGPLSADSQLDGAPYWISGEEDVIYFPAVAGAGDMNGDSIADLVIASNAYADPKAGAGRVWIVYGGDFTQFGPQSLLDVDDYIMSEYFGTTLGTSISGGGDLNGDGLADLLVGVPNAGRTSETVFGEARVFAGPIEGALTIEAADLTLVGLSAYDNTGFATDWAGDVNGDGHDDIFIGAPANFSEDTRGRAYLVYGPHNGTMSLENADATIQGEIDNGNLGHIVSRAGDTNNDGFEDLLIGAPLTDAEGQRSGRAWLFSGPLEGTYVASDADATFLSAGELDWTGYDVESAGDVNNDGFDDVLITAPQQYRYVPSRLARVSLFYGPLDGELTPDNADRVWASPYPHDTAGRSIAVGGDLNDDGRRDLVVGAPYDDEGGYEAGAVYLLTLE